jgi:erythromycin esterase
VDFIELHKNAIASKCGDLTRVLMAREIVSSAIKYHKQLISSSLDSVLIRDKGMADNLEFLMNTVYPAQKIIIWAHNLHIMHAYDQAIVDRVTTMGTMGSWIKERHRPILYTIGFYMYRGQAAWNNKTIYDLTPPLDNSLEAICNEAIGDFTFTGMLHQTQVDGNSWMFSTIPSKWWGYYDDREFIPRDQFDAILFVKEVHPPDYY